MSDPRFDQLAHVLVTHSTDLQKNEHVLIEAFDIPEDMIVALVRAVQAQPDSWDLRSAEA